MRREIIIAQSGMSENARWTRDLREFLRMKRAELKGQGYVVEGGWRRLPIIQTKRSVCMADWLV